MNKFWNWVKNEETQETELYFSGPISEESWYGDELTPAVFKQELSQHPGNLTVWLNSCGGDVFAASQIYTMLKNHKGKITMKIDALAASAASVVAMAGDETYITPTGLLMIHEPSTIAMGDTTAMEKTITILNEIKESIINAYELKTGLSRAKLSKMMSDETWLNAKKALQLGFVDGILFSKKELETDEPEEDENAEEDTPDEEEEKSDKPQKNTASMQYSPAVTTASFMKKISDLSPVKGVPIDQLDKRLALLNH